MNVYMSLYMVLLFVVLSPGILLRLPPKGSKLVVAVVHGLVFALVYYLTHKAVWLATSQISGFKGPSEVELAARANAQSSGSTWASIFESIASTLSNKPPPQPNLVRVPAVNIPVRRM